MLVLALTSVFAAGAHAQRMHRQSFEGPQPLLRLGLADGQVRLLDQRLVQNVSRAGKQSERIHLRISSGTHCHVECPIPPLMVIEELEAGAWLTADRPGISLIARVVLPRERDPQTGQTMTTLLAGERSRMTGQWERLRVARLDRLLDAQRRLLQARYRRPVDVSGAYVDVLVFDIQGGLGDVAIWVDDIEAGPVVSPASGLATDLAAIPANVRDEDGQLPANWRPGNGDRQDLRAAVIGDRLHLGGRPFFIRAIHATDVPVPALKECLFNTVVLDWPINRDRIHDATRNGLFVVPWIPLPHPRADLERMATEHEGSESFYLVGTDLDPPAEPLARSLVERLRQLDAERSRPIGGDVAAGDRRYSQLFDMVGVRREPLMTSLELTQFRDWLAYRKDLGRPGSFYWAWVQTHLPPELGRMLGEAANRAGPQPEQIELLTYLSLAAGYRGLVFSSDHTFAGEGPGRARQLRIALVNLGLTLVETFLAEGRSPIMAKTSHPDIGAAIYRHDWGLLVLAYWTKAGSQHVVGQASANDVEILVEGAAESAHAFQVTLGDVVAVQRVRDVGGVRVRIPEFDTTAMVVLTTNAALFGKYQQLVSQMVAPRAAAWQRELAEVEVETTEDLATRLDRAGRPDRDDWGLLSQARQSIGSSRTASERQDFRQAYLDAVRSVRLVRAVRERQWRRSAEGIASVTAYPFLVSWYTLPEHEQFLAELRQLEFGANGLPGGDFEESDGRLDRFGWSYDPRPGADLAASAMLVGPGAQGLQALELKVWAQRPDLAPVVEPTWVDFVSPPVRLEPGQVARISGKVRLAENVSGSPDGAMVWDSLGGKTLATRVTNGADWQSFVLYRPARRSTELRVHLTLTGIGTVLFDDLRIELAHPASLPAAGRPPAGLR